jgi:hypothetical protein
MFMSGFAAKEMHATQCVTMIEECLTETPVPPLEVLMIIDRREELRVTIFIIL